MKKTLKSIEPVQLGKIAGALYGLMGLIFVPFLILFAVIGSFAPKSANGPSGAVVAVICFAMAIFMPIVYAVMGFLFGIISAWLYNLIARWIGGIQVEVE
jgi:hypothetical protein